MTATVPRSMWRAVELVAGEVWWWLAGSGRLLRRHPWRWGLWVWVIGVAVVVGQAQVAGVAAGAVLVPAFGFGLWARLGPVSYQRWVAGPAFRHQTRRWLRQHWPTVMAACGLARHVPGSTGDVSLHVPALAKIRWDQGRLIAVPRLLVGQTLDEVEAATDRLRTSLHARRVRIVPDALMTGCRVEWSFGDLLAEPFDATIPPATSPIPSLDAVELGRAEYGGLWRLPLGVSTLTAGSSGSGKASLIWGLVFGLAPAIRTGLVQVYGIDLKGGMEFAMGQRLFTRYAQRPEHAVVLLEDAVRALQARAAMLAGITRQHTPSVADPVVLVLVDELAALVAYLPDRELTRRAEAALSVLLSQGRAVGVFVFAYLQDPRKETIKMRHLFTQAVGLRLRDRDEVAMVLGDGALSAGAWCHKIARSTPGVGYVLRESDGRPVKVRAGYVSDQMIRTCAQRFPAPRQIPVVIPEPETPLQPVRSPCTTRRARNDTAAA